MLRQVVKMIAVQMIPVQDAQHYEVTQLGPYHTGITPNATRHVVGSVLQVWVPSKVADKIPLQQVVGISLNKDQQFYINLIAGLPGCLD